MRILALLPLLLLSAMAQDQTPKRGQIIGIGGVFFKSEHQKELYAWYQQHLGLTSKPNEGVLFHWQGANTTTWAIFPQQTRYFAPSTAPFMINYIVDDLDALLARLKTEGVNIDPKRETDAAGRFAWIYDPDGNKIELWQPAGNEPSKDK